LPSHTSSDEVSLPPVLVVELMVLELDVVLLVVLELDVVLLVVFVLLDVVLFVFELLDETPELVFVCTEFFETEVLLSDEVLLTAEDWLSMALLSEETFVVDWLVLCEDIVP
jgi:hypothetical protein